MARQSLTDLLFDILGNPLYYSSPNGYLTPEFTILETNCKIWAQFTLWIRLSLVCLLSYL